MAETFRALVLDEADKGVTATVKSLTLADLPDGDVTVRVTHSSLNYKDGMILKGLGRLVRQYPHVPGIDLAGEVVTSDSAAYKPGDRVVLTGWRVGEVHWGGYAEYARVKAKWLVPQPDGLTPQQAMAVGTAGLSAALGVLALKDGGLADTEEAEVLVTGASGGVGGTAVAILSSLGYTVAAVTGRPENADYLKELGASVIVARGDLADPPAKPLLSERWAGCVDTVGGDMLAHVIAEMKSGSTVAAVGLAGGNHMTGTVLPFLLRGIRLQGIDSVFAPYERRIAAWDMVAQHIALERLDALTSVIGLDDLTGAADDILAGRIRGRAVVDLNL